MIDESHLYDPRVIRLTFPLLAECGGAEFTDEEGGDKDESEE